MFEVLGKRLYWIAFDWFPEPADSWNSLWKVLDCYSCSGYVLFGREQRDLIAEMECRGYETPTDWPQAPSGCHHLILPAKQKTDAVIGQYEIDQSRCSALRKSNVG